MAKAAGWKVGDVIVAIDGKELEGMRDLFSAVQDGSPRKTIVIERKGRRVSTTVDWSGTPGEAEREARRREREARQ